MRGVLVEELFSEEGVGTMVHTDSYREIRPLKEEDIPELLSMIARSVVDSKLVNRNYEDIAARMDSYYVLTLDDSIVGCVAVYPYPEHHSAELGCLYIKRTTTPAMKDAAMAAHYVNLPKEKRRKWEWNSSSPSPKVPSITSGTACITRNFPATACLRNVCAPWNSAAANPGFSG